MSNYKVDFMDSSGSPPEPVYYGTADMNNVRKSFMTKGVLMESASSCAVVAGTTGKVIISAGQAVMADGSRIEILTGGEELSILAGGKNYVFFHRSTSINSIIPTISLDEPDADDVALAEVDGGVITDLRSANTSYAKPAFAPPPCVWFEHTFDVTVPTQNVWQNVGTLVLPTGYNKLSFCINSNKSAFFLDTVTQKGGGWHIDVRVNTIDGKTAFPFALDTTYAAGIWFEIRPDHSIWAKRVGSTSTLTGKIAGLAFYGGAE